MYKPGTRISIYNKFGSHVDDCILVRVAIKEFQLVCVDYWIEWNDSIKTTKASSVTYEELNDLVCKGTGEGYYSWKLEEKDNEST